MNICFITYMFPGKHNSSDFAFVKQLVDAIAARGNHCFVLSPFNVLHYRTLSRKQEQYVMGNGQVTVLRPWYLSFSAKKRFLLRMSGKSHRRALIKAFRMMPIQPDVVYGHFWHAAFKGYSYAKAHNIPLFVASGESEIAFRNNSALKAAFCNYVRGVICVSSKNRDESIKLGLTTFDKCGVFPNAINADLFKKMDKRQCREQLGLPLDVFIVVFVGWFIERKGPLRVAEAIKRIKGKKVYSLFIGKGEQVPHCDNILFRGAVSHDEMPVYMNAADVFVLPTLHEGCCNAVIEAMACGLPVISSNLPFNWDVLDETNSIMINPNDIDEIADAIQVLRDHPDQCATLGEGALKRAKSLTIGQRAKAILEFIENKCSE